MQILLCYIIFEVNIMNETEIRDWMKENLVGKKEATTYTKQSLGAFQQAVNNGKIVPFFEEENAETSAKIRLYLKSELIEYEKNKRPNRAKNKD